ncbi:hypothetical protein [Anatilimnocola floriformis]|uniref:hypothetical protein n=1 Tax=Anatilimnocola floriformis TaxID=2948575 RepID=UPI0020C51819|nr:hypothetical protein [Anatilimnocola floriformis]
MSSTIRFTLASLCLSIAVGCGSKIPESPPGPGPVGEIRDTATGKVIMQAPTVSPSGTPVRQQFLRNPTPATDSAPLDTLPSGEKLRYTPPKR